MKTQILEFNTMVTTALQSVQDEIGYVIFFIATLVMLVCALFPVIMSGLSADTLTRAGVDTRTRFDPS